MAFLKERTLPVNYQKQPQRYSIRLASKFKDRKRSTKVGH